MAGFALFVLRLRLANFRQLQITQCSLDDDVSGGVGQFFGLVHLLQLIQLIALIVNRGLCSAGLKLGVGDHVLSIDTIEPIQRAPGIGEFFLLHLHRDLVGLIAEIDIRLRLDERRVGVRQIRVGGGDLKLEPFRLYAPSMHHPFSRMRRG